MHEMLEQPSNILLILMISYIKTVTVGILMWWPFIFDDIEENNFCGSFFSSHMLFLSFGILIAYIIFYCFIRQRGAGCFMVRASESRPRF